GLAFLGCALALALSVWGRKTHEVLLATYLIWVVLLLAEPVWASFQWWGTIKIGPPDGLREANPFLLCFATYARPGRVTLGTHVVFAIVALALSAGLTALAVLRMRAVAVRQSSQVQRGKPRRWLDRRVSLRPALLRLPGPSLDGNPVLWREWHRSLPSR